MKIVKEILGYILYTLVWAALASFVCYLFTGTVTKHDLFLCWMFSVLCFNIKIK